MDYDPIKDRLGRSVRRAPGLKRLFFRTLDAVFLRSWYVRREVRASLAESKRPVVHVLDAGTGFGQYAYWLLRRDDRVRMTAVDVKEDYLRDAKTFFDSVGLGQRIEFRTQDLTAPLAEPALFDLALAVDVLEHIEDDVSVLRHLADALRPGGVLVINTPSNHGGSDAGDSGESFIGEHVREGYSPDELAAKLASAGFEVERWTYTYGRYGSAAWRLLVKNPIRLLNRGWWLAPALVPYYAVAGPVGLALNAADFRSEKPTGTGLTLVARRR